jgi:glycosyltransferase, MGT family
MSKVLFINGWFHGHINPTLALVRELVIQGEEVVYFSTEDFKDKILNTGASFISYEEKKSTGKDSKPYSRDHLYAIFLLILKSNEAIVPTVIEKIKGMEFDYIIYDSMFGGGNIIAKILGLPAICSYTTMAINKDMIPSQVFKPGNHPDLDIIYEVVERLSKKWNIDTWDIMDFFFKKENLNIVYTSRLFQYNDHEFDDSYKFVGPSIIDRNDNNDFPLQELDGKKVIYINMGTMVRNTSFFKPIINMFADKDFKIVMSIGENNDISTLGILPGNFIVRNFAPQLEILKKSNVFICHGGMNGISEALFYGVPVISIPYTFDEPLNTLQLTKLGAGIGINFGEYAPSTLENAVNEILMNETYKTSCMKISDSFKKAGGYKTAVDYIFEYKNTMIK